MPKFAVITGASSGIGAEFARQLSARGYNLLLVARRADRLEKLSDQLTTVCEIFTADLSKKSECLRLVKALEGRRVDLFINNAGFGDCGPFLQTELDKDLDMLSVNIRALHILTKKIGQQLYKQGFGALLNVGSCAGLMPAGPYMATYYATKAYVVSLTSALAQELREARSPVYVGCLCPGPVNTEFNAVANVEFALRGITPEYCVRCALDGLLRARGVVPEAGGLRHGVQALQLVEQALRHKGGAQLLELRLQVVQFALIFFKFDHDSILQFRNIIYSIAERSPPVKGNFLPVQLVKKVTPGFFAKLHSELQNKTL